MTYCTYKTDGAKAGNDCPCGGQCVCNDKS